VELVQSGDDAAIAAFGLGVDRRGPGGARTAELDRPGAVQQARTGGPDLGGLRSADFMLLLGLVSASGAGVLGARLPMRFGAAVAGGSEHSRASARFVLRVRCGSGCA